MSLLNHVKYALALALVAALTVPVWAQATAEQKPTAATSAAVAPTTSSLVLGAGDLLHLTVLGAPEFERDVRVGDDGMVSLPMVGDLHIAGLTVTAAEKLLEKSLSDGGYYVEPSVSVLVKEYATQGISVLGEVQKPGIYQLLGEHTLFDAISAAGGTTPKAGRTVTITHRDRRQPPQTVVLAYTANEAPGSNVSVQPGDTVVVSKAGMVYVVGDVRQPTSIVLESPNLTVLQAIAMAQGTNSTAALNNAKVIRRVPEGSPKEIPVPLKRILSAKAPDVQLQAEDVLFVPNSVAKSAARRTFETALQTLSGVVIYGARTY